MHRQYYEADIMRGREPVSTSVSTFSPNQAEMGLNHRA